MIIKFFPEFFCYSIWLVNEDGTVNNISVDELPLSFSLKKDIKDWEEEYDSIFYPDYPPDSKFSSRKDEIRFWNKGTELFERLKDELPTSYKIFYISNNMYP